MAGLVEKDIRLLLQRKQIMVAFLALALMLGFTQEGTFILGYLPILILLLTIGTISYDELDQGFTFLFTLPVNAREYVTEKYLFCGIAGILSWIASIGIYRAAAAIHGEQVDLQAELPMLLSFLAVDVIMMAVMIPIQIKFGANGSRMILMVIFGAALMIVFLLKQWIGKETVTKIQHMLQSVSDTCFIAVVTLGVVAAVILSYVCSFRALKTKKL